MHKIHNILINIFLFWLDTIKDAQLSCSIILVASNSDIFSNSLAISEGSGWSRDILGSFLGSTGVRNARVTVCSNFRRKALLRPWRWDWISRFESLYSSSNIKSLGRDLDPRPLPYQGNALPGWATKALQLKTIGFINNIIWRHNWFHRCS